MTEHAATLHFADRDEWRAWLETNHTTKKELWLVIYKKHTGKKTLPYDEAVEEALCFGWIDGTLKPIDKESYRIRFSPRKSKSIWARSNRERAERMIAQGRMTAAGLAKIEDAKHSGEWYREMADENGTIIPEDLNAALAANAEARSNFEGFPPSLQQRFVYWITSAKRYETRRIRIGKTVEMAKRNERPS